MEYTSENIEQAVSLFYKTDSAQQATAHQWLTDAQNSPHAWSFVWDLLDPRRASEVQFFAATTLHIKLIRNWHEIPVDYYQELRKKIVDCIVIYATGPKLILNRLCITLSAYIIHTVPTHWPNAFGELIANFQPHNLPNIKPERVTWILLEILTVVPEEFHSSLLSGRRRLEVKSLLCNTSKDIITFVVQSCLVNSQNFVPGNLECNVNITTQLNVMRCLLAWIHLGHLTIADLSEMMGIITNLVCYVYWTTFTEEDVLDAMEELELIEVALEILTFILNQGSTYKYPTYVMKHMYDHVTKFGQIIEVEKSKSIPNREVVAFMLGLVINTSDSHCKKFVEELHSKGEAWNKKMVLQILDIVLACSDSKGEYPIDETDSFIPFTFWYTFQEEALSIQSKNKKFLHTVKSYYQRLVLVFLKKSAYSPQWGNHTKWSLDDRELFRCYRQDIADTYLYCYNVLNVEMLALLLEKLDSALVEYKSKRAHWSQVESCLHAFMAIAETIMEDNQYIPRFLDILRTIPYHEMNRKVLAMALDNVSAYSEWLADHPDLLDKIMPLLVLGMSNTVTDVGTSATFAVKDVACNCIHIIDKYAEDIIRLCHQNLINDQLKLTERMRIMQILGYVISVLPADQSMYYLQVILGPLVEEIQTLVNSSSSPTMIATLITKLKLVSSLFITLNHKRTTSEEPVVMVVQSSIPLYAQVADKYFDNEEIMKVLCELLKYTFSGLMNASKPLVPSIFQLLLNAYVKVPNVDILTLSQMILVLFGKDADMQEILNKYLIAIVGNTLQVFVHLNNCNRLSEQSDVVEGLFVLLGNVSKKTSCQINSAENLDYTTLFQCAIVCLALPEPATLKACVGFLTEFILKSRETGHASIVQNNGEALVNKILANLGGAAARSTTDLSVEVLFVLNKKYCDDLSRWLNVQLTQKDFPSSFVNNNQKQQFMVAVLREKSNKRKLLKIATEFTLICRQIIKEETPHGV